ncbi:N-acetylmuramoyl-L-alanine amidase family protein [Natronoflexus pectinivorans]|uniref:N-acetylmuramoyl-L-alanine amidase n=1 Tax=Natronoflexus pectinivorans TaxID=682526 RepID=A0A4R2G5I8_9BACT|nr:N-acetylmuramoyl-L-alanine amidase [Natronoflexus pectinivorans]TCO02701.1 N-acetylmuramoyl-L-alanine amidase [Natronoflexus pectinivorans]
MRYILFLLILFGVILIGAEAQNQRESGFRTVVIDPGHGGRDPGAVGRVVKEKDIVLAIGLKVGEYLNREMPELNVVFTRTEDVFVPLNERAAIANNAKADLFVSIHANSIHNPRIFGAETFVLGLHRSQENLEVAKRENSVIILEEDYTTTYQGFDPTSPESYIIFELMQNVYLDQSISAASLIQNQFESRVGRHNRGVKQAGFLVLRETAMPGVLVEVGFLSNAQEERFLASEEGQVYLASAIFRAIRDYKNRHEARSQIASVRPNVQSEIVLPETPPMVDTQNEVVFRIQVATTRQMINSGEGPYTHFDEVWVYEEGGLYKYTTGYSICYDDISHQLTNVREKIPDSFIVAFKNGERVPVSSVR